MFDVEGEDAVEGGEDGDVDEDAVDGCEEAGDGEEEECGRAGVFWGGGGVWMFGVNCWGGERQLLLGRLVAWDLWVGRCQCRWDGRWIHHARVLRTRGL